MNHMIEFTKAFKASDGKMHPTLQEAQQSEIRVMLDHARVEAKMDVSENWSDADVAGFIVMTTEKIVDILTTTETSRPKARAIHGAKKTRKPKVPPTITASETAA